MLMLKGFVCRDIVVSPAEMCGGSRFHSRACRACDGRDVDLVFQQAGRGKRQQGKLYRSCKAARIGQFVSSRNFRALPLGQTVNIALGLVAEVLSQVYDLQSCRSLVLRPETAALSVSRAHKQQIDSLKVKFVGKLLLRFAEYARMHLIKEISRIALRVDKCKFHLRMVEKYPYQFTGSVTGTACYPDPNH